MGLFKTLAHVILLDPKEESLDIKEKFSEYFEVLFFEDVVEEGAKNILPWAKITPASIYTFSYTSGTTGDSKGAMVSH